MDKLIESYRVVIVSMVLGMSLLACGGGGDDSGGGEEPRCDLVASNTTNPDAFFKVVNRLNSGLAWQFSNGIPFGADMKPNECTLFGLSPGGYSATFQQCNIADEACTSSFGPTKEVVFSVNNNETYTVEVTGGFFQ
jgi:hypothetical protein